MTKTFDIPCSIEQAKGTTQKETIVFPSVSEETIASANLYFHAPDRKGLGHYSISAGGAVDIGVSSFVTATGLDGVSSIALRFLSNGLSATGFGAFQASVEGEEWSLTRGGITFAFAGIGSLFGGGWISSTFFGLGFSAAEGTVGKFLDYYSLTALLWRSRRRKLS